MSCLRKNKAAPLGLAVALALAGCCMGSPAPDEPGVTEPGVPESRSPLGATMTLAGQVWVPGDGEVRNVHGEYEWDGEHVEFDGTRSVSLLFFDGNRLVDLGGVGNIADGRLNFNIGTPGVLVSIGFLFDSYGDTYDDFTIYPRTARAVLFHGMETDGDDRVGWIQRLHSVVQGTAETRLTSVLDEVFYVYVDRDVRISGTGRSDSGAGHAFSNYAWSFGDLNIVLEAGWNVMHVRAETTIEGSHHSTAVTMAAYDPGWVRWGLHEMSREASVARSPKP
ncbi:MAG: hypothetical protein FWB79_02490 [Treponema sp.]|nr:hypothetical protein [Treponema sp.]